MVDDGRNGKGTDEKGDDDITIDDLKPGMMTHKFIDDTTITEVIKKRQASQTASAVDELISWSSDNRMNVNTRKTKEMVLEPLARNPPHQLNIGNLIVHSGQISTQLVCIISRKI